MERLRSMMTFGKREIKSLASKVTIEEVEAFLKEAFTGRDEKSIVELDEGRALVRRHAEAEDMRPGGFISGPTQMAIADNAAYIAVFTKMGITPMAVTSNLTMNFLRPCIGDGVEAEATVMKMGRSLAVIDVDIRVAGTDRTCSHAVVTYALPKDED